MWCGKSSNELRLLPNLPSFFVGVCLLEMVADYYNYSFGHNCDCFGYFGYPSNPSLDSDFDSCTYLVRGAVRYAEIKNIYKPIPSTAVA